MAQPTAVDGPAVSRGNSLRGGMCEGCRAGVYRPDVRSHDPAEQATSVGVGLRLSRLDPRLGAVLTFNPGEFMLRRCACPVKT